MNIDEPIISPTKNLAITPTLIGIWLSCDKTRLVNIELKSPDRIMTNTINL